MSRSPVVRSALPALVVAFLLGPGCSLVYEHVHESTRFTLLADGDANTVQRALQRAQECHAAFDELFGTDDRSTDRVTIVLRSSGAGVVDTTTRPDLLGYYVPLVALAVVEVDALSPHESADLDAVLAHEVAHHFVAERFPRASEASWFDEGLASALETSHVGPDGRARHPLLHPVLLQIARRRLARDPRSAEEILTEVIRADRGDFHAIPRREGNYALAWSFAYFHLTRSRPSEEPLDERVARLARVDVDDARALADEWRRSILAIDPVAKLAELASSTAPGSPREWAVRQLGECRSIEGCAALEALVALPPRVDAEHEAEVAAAIVQRLARTPYAQLVVPLAVQEGTRRARDAIESASPTSPAARVAIERLGEQPSAFERWASWLVCRLDSPHPDQRVAAVRALARLGDKPTILSPSFWRAAPPADREAEAEEWRHWLRARTSAR